MLLRKIALANVRSFLDRAEFQTDGLISIAIGPNGGGKTNLLDTIVIALRRHMFASMYAEPQPTPDNPNLHVFRHNDSLNNMVLEKHSQARKAPQEIEIEIEVTDSDIQNIRAIQTDADRILELAQPTYGNVNLAIAKQWAVDAFQVGQRLSFSLSDGKLRAKNDQIGTHFLEYLRQFEVDGYLREKFKFGRLRLPMVYLPVNRSAGSISTAVELASFNSFQTKREADAIYSRNGQSPVSLAIGLLAEKYRLLLEEDQGGAHKVFMQDENLSSLTEALADLGYEWSLKSTNPMRNQYNVELKKQGNAFFIDAASSGERELMTYLFTIYGLNIRDALVIVDEPELHLHPKWQKTLLRLFERLTRDTKNQFLLATHSPTFVSSESIQYISRVFSKDQKSNIKRLDVGGLPDAKHLLNIVNTQNNERIFFADKVILVEGISDKIFFEAFFRHVGKQENSSPIIEIVDIGGKGFFPPYKKLLNACAIDYVGIADLDYVEQIGTPEIKSLFQINTREIKQDVIDNIKSFDGAALVSTIDVALKNGNWDHANDVWNYIKSRRVKLKPELTDDEQKLLAAFIDEQKANGIFILGRGGLESYLPEGLQDKDMEKLIKFASDPEFPKPMSDEAIREMTLLVNALLT